MVETVLIYADKLKDPRWQRKRLEIFERDNWTCRFCGDNTNTLHIHHLRYIPFTEPWDYPDNLLVTVCDSCHETFTNPKPKANKGCINCFHYQEFKHCSCRTTIDIPQSNCPDWR
jgi:5-methylcytosine-specific restriction endonuclease McrA